MNLNKKSDLNKLATDWAKGRRTFEEMSETINYSAGYIRGKVMEYMDNMYINADDGMERGNITKKKEDINK